MMAGEAWQSPTAELRAALDGLGVAWEDLSEHCDRDGYSYRNERTRFRSSDGRTVSCVFGWWRLYGHTHPLTYGGEEGLLEVAVIGDDGLVVGDPEPMSVAEAVEAYLEGR